MKSSRKAPFAEKWVVNASPVIAQPVAGVQGHIVCVILGKQQGLIESAAQVLHDLRGNGFHLDDAVIREALRRTVKEIW